MGERKKELRRFKNAGCNLKKRGEAERGVICPGF